MAIERLLGWADDPLPGGTPLDGRTGGAVAAPTVFFPAEAADIDLGGEARTRDNEITATRGRRAPEGFKVAPSVTGLAVRPYPMLLKSSYAKASGGGDSRTGTPPAAVTHGPIRPVGSGAAGLPAVDVTMVRDGLHEQVGGCQVGTWELELPLDGGSKLTMGLMGLWYRQPSGATPTPDYSAIEAHDFVIRDVAVYLDGGGSAQDYIQRYRLSIDNQLRAPDFNSGKHVYEDPSSQERLWYPARRRLTLDSQIEASLDFSEPLPNQVVRQLLRQMTSIVVEVSGDYLGSTPDLRELVRFTHATSVPSESNVAALSKDDDMTHAITFGVHVDPATGFDLGVEFVDASNVDIT